MIVCVTRRQMQLRIHHGTSQQFARNGGLSVARAILWTRVKVEANNHDIEEECLVNHLTLSRCNLQLTRSGNFPLDVKIQVSSDTCVLSWSVIGALLRHISRWRSLYCQGNIQYSPQFQKSTGNLLQLKVLDYANDPEAENPL